MKIFKLYNFFFIKLILNSFQEKDLVHKLFKVLVPRYSNYMTAYTDMHILPTRLPGKDYINQAVLELKGITKYSKYYNKLRSEIYSCYQVTCMSACMYAY